MDKDTFLEKIKEIGSLESAEEMRAGLAELNNGVSEVYDANASLTEQHEADIKEMEALRSANQKLFTMVGVDKSDKQAEEQTGLKQEPVVRRKFDDLLNHEGGFSVKA